MAKNKAKLEAEWEKRLHRMGLSMDAGRDCRLDYGHTTAQLDFDGRRTWPVETTEDEWPVSLA